MDFKYLNSEFLMFTQKERIAVFSLASIFIFRMLGLFIIIPIFSPYLQTLNHATPFLIGLTVGIYGLTQAICQIPLGILSDRFGRKEVITLGLIIFFIGSLISAIGNDIWVLLLGRALQGAAAISGVLIALISDLTRENVRTKAMAILGVSIDSAFIIAFILGPILSMVLSVNQIFNLIAIGVLPILIILWKITPTASKVVINKLERKKSFAALMNDKKLLKQIIICSFAIFSLHGILTANFIAIPILLKYINLSVNQQAKIYIVVFTISIVFMGLILARSEKYSSQQKLINYSVIFLLLSAIFFYLENYNLWGIVVGLTMFFTGFNILEATLPALISKLAPTNIKGSIMGVYSTAQFLGPVVGGVLAGIIFKYSIITNIFLINILWSILLIIILKFLTINK